MAFPTVAILGSCVTKPFNDKDAHTNCLLDFYQVKYSMKFCCFCTGQILFYFIRLETNKKVMFQFKLCFRLHYVGAKTSDSSKCVNLHGQGFALPWHCFVIGTRPISMISCQYYSCNILGWKHLFEGQYWARLLSSRP